MKGYYAALMLVLTTSCSSGKPLDMPVPANLGPHAKNLAEKSIPKIRAACPGLNKYGNALVYKGIEDSLNYANKITVMFNVSDDKSDIPNDYRAWGHSCYIDVDASGEKISIAKSPCKAVCLDQDITGTSNDTGNDMVISLSK